MDEAADAPEPSTADDRRHHAVIAGTGRSGTSFLVEFLGACGLQTAVGDQGPEYFGRARAGLEHSLVSPEELPYVVKDPWLFTYCEAVDLDVVAIDVLILPMRDLTEAATSRVLQERIALPVQPHRPVQEVYCLTPGGAVQSLDPTDQARLLAVGFHELLGWAVRNTIPVVLLDFPRLVEDGDYLVDALWPWLGAHTDRDAARAAFDALADPSRIRIKDGGVDGGAEAVAVGESDVPSAEELDRAALLVLLGERADEVQAFKAETWQAHLQAAHYQELHEQTKTELWQTHLQFANVQETLAEVRRQAWSLGLREARAQEQIIVFRDQRDQARDELMRASIRLDAAERAFTASREQVEATRAELAATKQRLRTDRHHLAEVRGQLAIAQAKLREVYTSRRWRFSKPLQVLGGPRHVDASAAAPIDADDVDD